MSSLVPHSVSHLEPPVAWEFAINARVGFQLRMRLPEAVPNFVFQLKHHLKRNKRVQRREDLMKSGRDLYERNRGAMAGISQPRVTWTREEYFRLIKETELEKHSLRVCMDVVASHSVVCSEMVDSNLPLNIRKSGVRNSKVISGPPIRLRKVAAKPCLQCGVGAFQ